VQVQGVVRRDDREAQRAGQQLSGRPGLGRRPAQ
jgi:hypothetical protein